MRSLSIVRPLLESARKKTRPRQVDLYDVFCGVLYLLKSGVSLLKNEDVIRWFSCLDFHALISLISFQNLVEFFDSVNGFFDLRMRQRVVEPGNVRDSVAANRRG